MKRLNALKRNQGITLIALVVTIVVLLILAGITINMLFSNGGIFKTAQDAANAWNEATVNEQESLNNLAEQIENLVNGQVGGGTEEPEDPTTGPNGKPLVETATEIQTESNLEAEDEYGNPVVVPKGFKVVTSEATTVPEGIVIEDSNGNQFVWIPVGTVHKDSNPANDVTIKLGRYTFDKTNGTPTMQQSAFAGDNPSSPSQTYADEVPIMGLNDNHIELDEARPGTVDNSNHLNDLNATAKNLIGFVESVRDNGGYYLARYEASYGSGYNSTGSTDIEKYANAKPVSQVSKSNSTSSMTYDTPGQLWNFITQLNASKVSQNMYANDSSVGVESDLTNSYAWDTAIVFIQSMKAENSNYANKKDGNGTLKNTGETGDKVCNIFDMAANIYEWTTEYSTYTRSSLAYPCTYRGGNCYDRNIYTASRHYSSATNSGNRNIGIRVVLYVK